MKENKHGFEPKQEFTMGGIAWTVIQTGADWVKCIASDCVEERAFDEGNKNDFAASSLRAYLRLIIPNNFYCCRYGCHLYSPKDKD